MVKGEKQKEAEERAAAERAKKAARVRLAVAMGGHAGLSWQAFCFAASSA